jgi:hypothetical protein
VFPQIFNNRLIGNKFVSATSNSNSISVFCSNSGSIRKYVISLTAWWSGGANSVSNKGNPPPLEYKTPKLTLKNEFLDMKKVDTDVFIMSKKT